MRFYRPDVELIQSIAKMIDTMYPTRQEKLQAVMDYVLFTSSNPNGMIEYVPDIDQPTCRRVDCKKDPITAIAEGYGDCEEIAAANASILKAMGIPSNVVSYGELWNGDKWEGHVWVESWDDKYWYIMETTVPELYIFDINQNPYDVLTEYRPVTRVRGW